MGQLIDKYSCRNVVSKLLNIMKIIPIDHTVSTSYNAREVFKGEVDPVFN
jgi:hypothetical protein